MWPQRAVLDQDEGGGGAKMRESQKKAVSAPFEEKLSHKDC